MVNGPVPIAQPVANPATPATASVLVAGGAPDATPPYLLGLTQVL